MLNTTTASHDPSHDPYHLTPSLDFWLESPVYINTHCHKLVEGLYFCDATGTLRNYTKQCFCNANKYPTQWNNSNGNWEVLAVNFGGMETLKPKVVKTDKWQHSSRKMALFFSHYKFTVSCKLNAIFRL